MEWYSAEASYEVNNKTNGSRTLYLVIIGVHAREGRYAIGQGPVQILTVIPEEIREIEESIDEVGLINYIKEKYNLEVEQIKTTGTAERKREIEVILVENDDEGCVAGDNLLKEEDRLNLKWR